ncbi:MAG: hypothetical protein PWQ54_1452 [Bacteroidales bacterium]|jgi:hypothetical protein|nr:hypothetical protein [Bacteroidales bacterium]
MSLIKTNIQQKQNEYLNVFLKKNSVCRNILE